MGTGWFEQIPTGGGGSVDLYLLRYDKEGRLRSPQAHAHLLDRLDTTSDVYLFSHGWNNVFAQALDRYRHFARGYIAQGQEHGITRPVGHAPVLVGVIWPSTSFVLPWEVGPDIAAAASPDGPEAARTEELLTFVTESLTFEKNAELTELVDGRTELDAAEARRGAEIVLSGLRGDTDPDDGSAARSVDDFLTAWAAFDERSAPVPTGAFGTIGTGNDADPGIAGGFSLDPRGLLRTASVWTMKDRAGTVGAAGVGPLVRHVLGTSEARLHLIGHSFGARLLLSALAVEPVARRARSMLLLQAAVNRWCFADDVAGTGRAGGYRPVLDRVELPLLTTFSRHDVPLTQAFHLALRGSNLGEPDIAAIGDIDRYGALGGYGPKGLDDVAVSAVAPGGSYRLDQHRRVIAVDGGIDIAGQPAIGGHGDVSTPATWWALHCLTGATVPVPVGAGTPGALNPV